MEMKFGFCQKKADGVKLYGLIARKVDIEKKVAKKNWECQVVFRRLDLVDAAPDPAMKKEMNGKHRYRKCGRINFG